MDLRPIPQTDERARPGDSNELQTLVFEKMQAMYARSGFTEPWIGYYAEVNGQIVGSCGFKNGIKNGKVEISYFTFPAYERKGYAKTMCRMLTKLAMTTDKNIVITAQTLPAKNISHRILESNNYRRSRILFDAEHGEVWEWEYDG